MADVGLTSGMRANLISLQGTASMMQQVQNRLATGKKVNSAIDNPTNYFTAQNHTARADKLSAKKDLMNEAIQTTKAASAGIEAIKKLIESARGIAQSAKTSTGTDLTALQTSYDAISSQIDKLASDSSYKGVNLLAGGEVAVDFNEDGTNQLTITGFDATTKGDLKISAADFAQGTGGADATKIGAALKELDKALSTIQTNAQTLAANLNVVQTRFDFTNSIIATETDGAAKLTDADMNEEGASLLMLQTRQSLGTSSLSMASQSAQTVLRLFA